MRKLILMSLLASCHLTAVGISYAVSNAKIFATAMGLVKENTLITCDESFTGQFTHCYIVNGTQPIDLKEVSILCKYDSVHEQPVEACYAVQE